MLEGLMQHDHPLTLQLVLERMRGMNGDAEVVTLTDDGTTRATGRSVVPTASGRATRGRTSGFSTVDCFISGEYMPMVTTSIPTGTIASSNGTHFRINEISTTSATPLSPST